MPGYEKPGIFEGRYRLTEHDIASNTIFEDWVVADAVAGFGNHSLVGSGPDANNLPYNGKPYTIPYRCLLPKDVQNLLLCGRCISGTHMAHASYRLMPICMPWDRQPVQLPLSVHRIAGPPVHCRWDSCKSCSFNRVPQTVTRGLGLHVELWNPCPLL